MIKLGFLSFYTRKEMSTKQNKTKYNKTMTKPDKTKKNKKKQINPKQNKTTLSGVHLGPPEATE